MNISNIICPNSRNCINFLINTLVYFGFKLPPGRRVYSYKKSTSEKINNEPIISSNMVSAENMNILTASCYSQQQFDESHYTLVDTHNYLSLSAIPVADESTGSEASDRSIYNESQCQINTDRSPVLLRSDIVLASIRKAENNTDIH